MNLGHRKGKGERDEPVRCKGGRNGGSRRVVSFSVSSRAEMRVSSFLCLSKR